MYPLYIPGISGESWMRFKLKNNANDETLVRLVSDIPPDILVSFYDQEYPSPSDPGAGVTFKKVDNQLLLQRANHGWHSKWEPITADDLVDYLSQCLEYNNYLSAGFAQLEPAISYYEKEISNAREAGDRIKEADNYANIGDILYIHFERALEFYEKALKLYREVGESKKEAGIRSKMAKGYGEMARVYHNQRKHEKAIEAQQKRVKILEETEITYLSYAREELAYYQKAAIKKWWQFWK